MSHPYSNLPQHCYWSRAVSDKASWQVDPMTRSKIIGSHERVVTMGSCFAQHIARHLASVGLNFFITETPPEDMSLEEATRRNYGVFSARYDNVYTTRQALQLVQRAMGKFIPAEDVWGAPTGTRVVDPFRPNIEPDFFPSEKDLRDSRAIHLQAVKKMFLEADWMIFTLGLTEAWRSTLDGSVYPIAPGVLGGSFNSSKHEFVNFSVDEVRRDLFGLIEEVTTVNPNIKFLLTVSPVPLAASYENRHVLVSTCFSKSVLRVCCDEAERAFDNVTYFPSFEIITAPSSGNSYFKDDFRQVNSQGVSHVMRVFSDHFVATSNSHTVIGQSSRPILHISENVICQEEALDSY
jgi:hypothetical protein